ncbi:dolichyl-phosphate beta-glucosyltransferase [Chytridiales sp. JEL 0842]|nr:dolichyl-phosphate beta-glucosyltransferase [Chytridiales sp. JEL 0842]
MILELILTSALLLLSLFLTLSAFYPLPRKPTDNERHFKNIITGRREKFPYILDSFPSTSPSPTRNGKRVASPPDAAANRDGLVDSRNSSPTRRRSPRNHLTDNATDQEFIHLSVVIPAYNEEKRLPSMLTETLDFLEQRRKKDSSMTFEVIVVDDGSTDATKEVAAKVALDRKSYDVRILVLEKNRGKGGAVTQGMLASRGDFILFADADGASTFADVEKLEKAILETMKDGSGVAVGSRAHMVKSEAVVKRSFIRNLLMHAFHYILFLLGIHAIKDTQCGFKLFSKKATAKVCPNMHVEGWIFDIEMLLLASWQGIPIAEVPINWHEVEGSKVSILRDAVRMALDLLVIRANYLLGVWKVKRREL